MRFNSTSLSRSYRRLLLFEGNAQHAADNNYYVNDQRPNHLGMYKTAEAEQWSMQFILSVNMEFVDLSTGGKKLLFNGYSYTRKANKKNTVRWECSERRAFECKGAVITSLQINAFITF